MLQGKKRERELQMTLMYLTLSFYSSIQYKYFRYEPNENVMQYTINQLSNKYDIKKYGTMFKLLFETTLGNHQKYASELESGDDLGLRTYLSALRTRINSKIKNIADEFEKVRKLGLYLNTEQENQEEEGFHETDNLSFQVNKVADKATQRILTGGIDAKILNICAENSGVSSGAVKTALYNIMDKKNHEIREFVVLILQMYLVDGHNDMDTIKSKKFVVECIGAYSKSNTVNKTILRMKKILDKWLIDCSDRYVKTERIATKSNFRRAIFMYFMFMIQVSYSR